VNTTRSGRSIAAVNALVAGALIVVLAAVALVVKPPSPPGIAEFAPQAAKPITKAPPGQGAVHGAGAGGCAEGQQCAAPAKPVGRPTPGAPLPKGAIAAGVPSALQCYTWPDGSVTQTFDPQSPPCVSSWPEASAGNGGATTRGVTATAIRLGVPGMTDEERPAYQSLVNFFNARFELYGRQFVLVPLPETGNDNDPSKQKADADSAKQAQLFATLDYGAGTRQSHANADSPYFEALARNRVISVAGVPSFITDAEMQRWSPYIWSVHASWDRVQRATAAVICRQLRTEMAAHSVDFSDKPRRYGLVLPNRAAMNGGNPPSAAVLTQELTRCSAPYTTTTWDGTATDLALAQTFTDWRAKDVTTLVVLEAEDGDLAGVQKTASQMNYHPEWLLAGTGWEYLQYIHAVLGQPDQMRSVMIVETWNKILKPASQMHQQAYASVAGPPASLGATQREAAYHELLVLASGVQMAGPRLTVGTFDNALHSTVYPNPGAGAAPFYQATVGFEAGSRQWFQDFGLGWWNAAANDYQGDGSTPKGAFCLIQGGKRWALDEFPSGDPGFFDGTGCP
jgi:hypothetical protein